MNTLRRWQLFTPTFTIAIVVSSLVAIAGDAGTDRRANLSVDAEIQIGGTLRGQVIERQSGKSSSGTIALLSVDARNNRATVVSVAKIGQDGRFELRGIRAGQYELRTNWTRRVVRLWSPGTAPPSALKSLALVEDATIVRGQFGGPPSIFAPSPADLLFWGTVGAGVGIPLAVTKNNPTGS